MFHGQRILLVDDVYTTGITVRQIGSLLYDRGAREVSSLTLCRSRSVTVESDNKRR